MNMKGDMILGIGLFVIGSAISALEMSIHEDFLFRWAVGMPFLVTITGVLVLWETVKNSNKKKVFK